MGIKVRHLVVAAAVLALAGSVMAQGAGGGGQGRGGFGMMGGQRGAGGGGAMQLLNIKEVQDELKINADQKAKIDALQTKQREDMQKMMEDMRAGGGQMDREAMTKAFTEAQAKQTKALNEILTPEQQKRLKELRVQRMGASAVFDPEIQKDLKLTDKQKEDLKALQQKEQQANMELGQKMRNQEITREDFQKIRQDNQKAMDVELGKLLTKEQADQLKAMRGKEFKFPVRQPGTGGAGGRGGGGGIGG